MRFATLLSAAMALALVFSGCLSSDDDPEPEPATPTEPDAPTPEPEAPTPDTPPPTPNTTPTATLTADVATGDAPLSVNFSIDGGDEDGDALSWTLDADGDGATDADGTEVPATANFTFDQVGNYTALLQITDGTDVTEANVTLTVSAAATGTMPEPVTFAGNVAGAWVGAGDAGGPEYVGSGPSHKFNFTAAIGLVQNFTVTVVGTSEGAVDLDFEIYAPDGSQAVRQANFNNGVVHPAQEDPVTVEDATLLAMPGDWTITVRPGIAVNGSYEVTVVFA